MALSKVKICNMALGNLGSSDTIESLTENSVAAKQCNLWYDESRQEALEAFDWSFARKRQALAPHSEDPPDAWSYRYQYPADCVTAREIENPLGAEADPVPFTVEMAADGTKCILTNLDEAVLVYTYDQETVSSFSKHFVRTLAFAIALNICMVITGKRTIKQDMAGQLSRHIALAPAHNANEEVKAPPRDADWIRGR